MVRTFPASLWHISVCGTLPTYLYQYTKVSLFLLVCSCKGTPHQVKVVFTFLSRHHLQYNLTHLMATSWRHIQLESTYMHVYSNTIRQDVHVTLSKAIKIKQERAKRWHDCSAYNLTWKYLAIQLEYMLWQCEHNVITYAIHVNSCPEVGVLIMLIVFWLLLTFNWMSM